VQGACAEHAFAFCRKNDNAIALVVAPRLFVGLTPDTQQVPLGEGAWKDTHLLLGEHQLGDRRWRNVFTGERYGGELRLAEVFAHFPIALLLGD
jgi:maltooligosyltrehalose synthase